MTNKKKRRTVCSRCQQTIVQTEVHLYGEQRWINGPPAKKLSLNVPYTECFAKTDFHRRFSLRRTLNNLQLWENVFTHKDFLLPAHPF
jgi:hypothetical protein